MKQKSEQTQSAWVMDMLKTQGEVTRNGALQMYISRLGAIICDLKKEGWDIKGEWRRHDYGRDYVYTLIGRPTKVVTKHSIKLVDGKFEAVPYQETIMI